MIVPRLAAVVLLAALSLPLQLHAAPPSQFEIDLKELEPAKQQAPKKKQTTQSPSRQQKTAPVAAPKGDHLRYTVKPGDHIFKILMVNFGMSSEEAERIIPEIIRLNDIDNIKTLKVGRTLLIPSHREPAAAGRAAKKPAEDEAGEAAKAPVSGGADRKAAPAAPKPAQTARKKTAPAPAPAPAPAKQAAAPVPVPAPPAVATPAPPAPLTNTWICTIPTQDTGKTIDVLLNSLAASWTSNRVVESPKGFAIPFSIKVDRYFEYKGGRYIVTIGESDPYSYTLVRMLETAGYRVMGLTGTENPRTLSEKLLTLVGVKPDFGKHQLEGGAEATGFLLRQNEAGGRQVLVTEGAATPGYKWILPQGCESR